MDLMKMMKEAANLKSKMAELDRSLKDKILDLDYNGVGIKINGKSEILALSINPEVLKRDHKIIEETILSALQQAAKKSQDLMLDETKKLTGGFNIPGITS